MWFKKYFIYLKNFDWLLLAPIFLLSFFGLATLYSGTLNVTTPDWTLFNKQLLFFIIGIFLLIITSVINYRHWKTYAVVLYGFSILLLTAVLFFGTTIRGTTGWFYFLGFGLQPAELMKFVLVLMLAWLYTKRRGQEKKWSTLLLVTLITLIPIILAMLQPDFGSAAIMFGIGFGFYMLLSMKPKNLILIIIIFILIATVLWNFILLDYQKTRINTFIHPMTDPLGKGYNVRQAIIAVGSGQLIGRGLGLGMQSQLHFLPETTTDFIFAAIAETLGFLGTSLIIIFFIALFIKLIFIMRQTKDSFGIYVIYGFGLIFFMQSVINIGMNIGILPIVGLSLPFVSYGGSFLIICMLAIGIIESIKLRQTIV